MIAIVPASDFVQYGPEPAVRAAGLERARSKAAITLTLAFWASGYLLQMLATALSGNRHLASIGAIRIVTTLIGLCLCYLIHRVLQSRLLSSNRARLVAVAIISPVLAEIYAWISFFSIKLVDPMLNLSNFTWTGAVQTIAFWTWFFLAWCGLHLALLYSFDIRAEQEKSAELREQAHVAQLRALHSQVNPHFLFNSLNSVSALILDKKVELAEEMVGKLARFLRLGLAADPTKTIALSVELELQVTYLQIEQLRFPDLAVQVAVHDELKGAQVPALILQPVVENAVKFGVAGSPPPASISIAALSRGSQLILEVTDSGSGKTHPSSGAGIGLTSIRQRLAVLHGQDQANIETKRASDGTFKVTITLPLRFA